MPVNDDFIAENGDAKAVLGMIEVRTRRAAPLHLPALAVQRLRAPLVPNLPRLLKTVMAKHQVRQCQPRGLSSYGAALLMDVRAAIVRQPPRRRDPHARAAGRGRAAVLQSARVLIHRAAARQGGPGGAPHRGIPQGVSTSDCRWQHHLRHRSVCDERRCQAQVALCYPSMPLRLASAEVRILTRARRRVASLLLFTTRICLCV